MKPNFNNEMNKSTKNLNEIINKNIFESILLDKHIAKTNESIRSKTILKHNRKLDEIVENTKINSTRNFDFNSEDTKLMKINTEDDKISPKNGKHQTSQSLHYYLPAITQITPRRKSKLFTYSTVDKIKKVENLFKTEMRIRENIKRSIINNKSIDLDNKSEINNSQKIAFEDKIRIKSVNDPIDIVKEIYTNIKTHGSNLDSNQHPIQVKRIPKHIPLKLIRRKDDYNSINSKISFPLIINDNKLMCRIFNENMSQINKNIVSNSNNKDKQKHINLHKGV